ncbi:hypothetical protein FACS1894111_08720 [Clostridia bacterium]|nr:hypothetical protein FACS1894111_08720 [Clostridia bacterium]
MVGNLNEIRNEGYRVLTRGLGAAGTAVFLRQFENGNGNYTEERRIALDENSIDSIVARIKSRKENE